MDHSVAVVGMSGRFPGAPDVETFWRNLCEGVESISRFSAADLAAEGVSPATRARPNFVGAGGALDGIEDFDAGLFGYSPREAEIIDPQHRVFLECAWSALENAGYNPFTHPGAIGVYAGTSTSSYFARLRSDPDLVGTLGTFQLSIGNEKDHLTTRVAYKLDLHGPAVTVQTTCSSSLVAVVLAWQSLLTGQCDIALAGGVSIGVPQRTGYLYQQGGILSPDGHCRAFDAGAAGAVGGNGCAVVVLRRLDDAVADGDTILAVLSGAAINNDGARKVGYTAPSIDGQADVIRRAHELAGVDPDDIGYVEAHGTGTPLGDPIELAALTQAFRSGTQRRGFCALGSVKTNVGHLDTAAGVAGLIKAVLAVGRGVIPASLNFEKPNPALELDRSPFFVSATATDWVGPRLAGVSSFGIGGTNAHVVVEQPPVARSERPGETATRPHLVVLTARTAAGVDDETADLIEHLNAHPELDLADVAYTLQVGRVHQAHRRFAVVRDRASLAAALGAAPSRSAPSSTPSIAFLLPGQGAQHVGMAGRVYAAEPVFRDAIDHAARVLIPELGLDLRDVIFDDRSADGAADTLRLTAIAQPALFAVEYALAATLASWGVRPDALLGHSVGELVAACLAGTIGVDEGLGLIAERGRLMQQVPGGAMLAVGLSESDAFEEVGPDCSVAAVNGPRVTVLSGPHDAIARIEGRLADRGVSTTRLHTSHAFHSAMMEPVLAPFTAHLRTVTFDTPSVPWISNLHGRWIEPQEATDPGYWAGHLRRPVRFADGLTTLLEDPDLVVLEVGPGQTLTRLARSHSGAAGRTLLATLPAPTDRTDDHEHLVATLGRLHQAGATVDWSGLHHGRTPRRIPLPGHRFHRQRYWISDRPRPAIGGPSAARPVVRTSDPQDWTWVPGWRRVAPPPKNTSDPAQTWLLVGDDEQAADLERALRAGGHRVTRVAGPASDAIGAVLAGTGEEAVHIGYLGGRSAAGDRAGQELLGLAAALVGSGFSTPVDLVLPTRAAFDVTGAETLQPAAALLLGPARVIPQEHPWIRCRVVDIDEQTSLAAPAVLTELTSTHDEPTVALRAGRRWVPTFDRWRLGTPAGTGLRDGGTYLVTGGLGRIGLTVAAAIAETVRANLVLVGRTGLPPREDWPRYLLDQPNGGARHAAADRIRAVRRLEERGADVLVLSADVANAVRMTEVIDEIHRRFGPLSGVVHAAGATGPEGFRPIARMEQAVLDAHLGPKVTGTRVLADVIEDEDVDFCLLFSSLSALLGGLGFAGYAAANAFLDAFAAAQARAGKPWTSVNWDGWDFGTVRRDGALALTPAEGAAVFGRLLAGPLPPQVAVSTGDLGRRYEQWVSLTALREKPDRSAQPPAVEPGPDDRPTNRTAAGHSRPDLSTEYAAAADDVEQLIADTWQYLLGIDRIGRHDNFFELGGHSLLAVQSASRIRDAFHLDVGVQTLFDAPTVAGLAAAVRDALLASATGDELAEILTQVESLSDEEIAALLVDE